MSIVRYSPFGDFDPFRSLATFEDAVNRFFAEPGARPWVPPVDIRETEHELIVKADIPDVKIEDIDVRLENGTLMLRGERTFEDSKKEGGWHRVERSYGKFERSFTLPDTVDAAAVRADYKNGTLTVTLPKKEIARPRQVKIEVNQ